MVGKCNARVLLKQIDVASSRGETKIAFWSDPIALLESVCEAKNLVLDYNEFDEPEIRDDQNRLVAFQDGGWRLGKRRTAWLDADAAE